MTHNIKALLLKSGAVLVITAGGLLALAMGEKTTGDMLLGAAAMALPRIINLDKEKGE